MTSLTSTTKRRAAIEKAPACGSHWVTGVRDSSVSSCSSAYRRRCAKDIRVMSTLGSRLASLTRFGVETFEGSIIKFRKTRGLAPSKALATFITCRQSFAGTRRCRARCTTSTSRGPARFDADAAGSWRRKEHRTGVDERHHRCHQRR